MERNQRRPRPSEQRPRISLSRYYRIIQIRGLIKLQKMSNKTRDKIGNSLNFCFITLILLYVFLHFAHISCFYSVKTYIDTIDIQRARSNFLNKTDDLKPILIAEVQFSHQCKSFIREIPLKVGGILMLKMSMKVFIAKDQIKKMISFQTS
ncbi:UNKNOWN [Stylonychia lemnae]|uniref:Uncharacterized protein n=1 Tax=Stylonychia lemnae TaxID=5949 RepID=A0A077ZWD9_STYLE|nr:UNKNOWN [Stylonychia lemnae]|eukprot:CDW72761.1 UNKNOWN [Stylonychia lemnae]